MSSWKNAKKSAARSYKERSQPESRKHLGLLEKKKDYKARAVVSMEIPEDVDHTESEIVSVEMPEGDTVGLFDFQRKQKTLKALERKALNRNPDEFYFNMVKTEKKDGVHQLRETDEPECSEDQAKLMFSQDQNYVNLKRTAELKKIERLKASLHMIDCEEKPQNSHIVFVDSKKEAKNFDAATYFNTHPSLLGRQYNRPTLESLQRGDYADIDEEEIATSSMKQRERYSELKKRIQREKELKIISQKLERKKQLMQDPKQKRVEVAKETRDAPAQYKWTFKRKR